MIMYHGRINWLLALPFLLLMWVMSLWEGIPLVGMAWTAIAIVYDLTIMFLNRIIGKTNGNESE